MGHKLLVLLTMVTLPRPMVKTCTTKVELAVSRHGAVLAPQCQALLVLGISLPVAQFTAATTNHSTTIAVIV